MEELQQFLKRIKSIKHLRNSIARSDIARSETISRKTSRILQGFYIDSQFVKKYSKDVSDAFLDKPTPNLSALQIQQITKRVKEEHQQRVRKLIQRQKKNTRNQSKYDNLPTLTHFIYRD
jgi:hypothetical protein